jgi:hypothetical protein
VFNKSRRMWNVLCLENGSKTFHQTADLGRASKVYDVLVDFS